MNTYAALAAFLAGKTRRTIVNLRNTEVIRLDSTTIAVRYHQTDVVLAHIDGTFTLNSAGYRTRTTKERFKDYSPANVWAKRGAWFVGADIPFYDGVRIDLAGNVIPLTPAIAVNE